MSKDPKERFKPFVKQGFITERQRLNLNPAYLDYLTQKNKKRNHKPRRVSDAEWAKVKAKIKEKHRPKQVAGKNTTATTKKTTTTTKKTTAVPSAGPPGPRRSSRIKGKKGKK
eukprot:COSAG04_NODE_370_length_15729_cov_5.743506_14_plen_113_part_00